MLVVYSAALKFTAEGKKIIILHFENDLFGK